MNDKKIFWFLVQVSLAVLIFVGVSLVFFLRDLSSAELPARVITVSAEGKAIASYDLATLSFSVISEGKDPQQIQDENVKKMNEAIAFAKAQGIDSKDIKTAQFNLSPRYYYPQSVGGQVLNGYTVTQTVIIKIRDFKKISPILAGLPGKGINQVNGPTFSIDNPDTFLNEARKEAFEKARMKVLTMAKQNGVRVGRVVTFSESNGGFPRPYMYAEAAMIKDGGSSAPPLPTIEPGSDEVSVQVSVTYELR